MATQRQTGETGEEAQRALLESAVGLDFVRFSFADIHGICRGKAVSVRHLAKYVQDTGPGMFCGIYCVSTRASLDPAMPALKKCGEGLGNGTMTAKGDRVYELPWAGGEGVRVGELMCETAWSSGEPQEACPRYVARKQLDRLDALGLNILSASEMEFNVYKGGDTRRPLFEGKDVFCHLRMADLEACLYKMDAQLSRAGIDLEIIHTEYGAGQIECVMSPVRGMHGADSAFRLKQAIKEIFRAEGQTATFMSRPAASAQNSGAHFNHSLWRSGDGGNAFHDPAREDKLSDVARHWIAGLLTHLPALTALTCPTVNCYRRMGESFCPDKADWGIDARTAGIRAKNNSPQATYVENRVPSAAANPYLVFAGTIAAGLDGITNKLECPPQKQDNAEVLPRNLSAALEALENDKVLCDALGQEFIECFTQSKRAFEVTKFQGHNLSENLEEELEVERNTYFELL